MPFADSVDDPGLDWLFLYAGGACSACDAPAPLTLLDAERLDTDDKMHYHLTVTALLHCVSEKNT